MGGGDPRLGARPAGHRHARSSSAARCCRASRRTGRRRRSSSTDATSPAETWVDDDGAEFHPGVHYVVGGNTKVYGASLPRLREEDFEATAYPSGVVAGLAVRLRRHRAVLRAGRVAVPRARHDRGGPDRAVAQQPVPVPAAGARAVHPRDDPAARGAGPAPVQHVDGHRPTPRRRAACGARRATASRAVSARSRMPRPARSVLRSPERQRAPADRSEDPAHRD